MVLPTVIGLVSYGNAKAESGSSTRFTGKATYPCADDGTVAGG